GAGRPRMGIDTFEGDLPQEAGLMDAVDFGKGQFLGREALAAIDTSTPLRSVVVAVETSEPVSPGEQLSVAGERAGELTSVTGAEDGVLGLARVFWRSEEHTSELHSPDHLVCRLLLEKKNRIPNWVPLGSLFGRNSTEIVSAL